MLPRGRVLITGISFPARPMWCWNTMARVMRLGVGRRRKKLRDWRKKTKKED
jgi:hypothetical protein